MTFDTTLRKIADGCQARAVALMGGDGIAIAQVDGASASEDSADEISIVGVEFGRILDEMRKASDSVDGGAVEEVSVRLAHFHVLVRGVDTETMLVVTLPLDANSGKARFLMRRHLLELREQL